jgi:hypothetical protein
MPFQNEIGVFKIRYLLSLKVVVILFLSENAPVIGLILKQLNNFQ